MTWPVRRYFPSRRVGLLSPSANPAVEPEIRLLLPDDAALHVARLPVMPGTTLEQRNASYMGATEAALGNFGNLALDVLMLGLTGPSYALTPEEDSAQEQRLSEQAGRPFFLASRAIARTLKALGRNRLFLFSPYPGWLTERAERYWQAAGLELAESYKVSETFRAYELEPEEVADALTRISVPSDCALLLSGTGMATLDAMAWMRRRLGVPMVSSNLACAYAACAALKLKPSVAMQDCAPELAEKLR
jgi:maleate isomerase